MPTLLLIPGLVSDGFVWHGVTSRMWKAMRFSWQLTMMMHRFPQDSD